MKVAETHTIDAPPEVVWPYVADPVLMSGWNDKIVAVRRDADAEVRLDEAFGMTYRMSGRDNDSAVDVIVCDPPSAVAYRHTGTWKGKTQVAVERYDLEPRGGGTRVTQTIDLSRAGIPWFFRLLIKFIDRFGESQGLTSLELLEKVVREDLDGRGGNPSGRGNT